RSALYAPSPFTSKPYRGGTVRGQRPVAFENMAWFTVETTYTDDRDRLPAPPRRRGHGPRRRAVGRRLRRVRHLPRRGPRGARPAARRGSLHLRGSRRGQDDPRVEDRPRRVGSVAPAAVSGG